MTLQVRGWPPNNVIVGGEIMPETIVNILDSIAAVRGQEYVEGLVDMANILSPKASDEKES